MQRAQCKGRTLVLKLKLHTFEVFTRQTVVPKAICLAEDLYNYSVPILTKLEQEMPEMKIRLMGLRCTHLVSTKKPDTLAFFGLKPRAGISDEPGKVLRRTAQAVDDDGWEKWPEDLLDSNDAELVDEYEAGLSAEESAPRRHGKEIMPNPKPATASPSVPEEWWQCPICSRPQPTDERLFNDHIDTCLSRQAIRDTVQKDAREHLPSAAARIPTPEPKRPKPSSEKKRGRPPAPTDPKQKRLCFG